MKAIFSLKGIGLLGLALVLLVLPHPASAYPENRPVRLLVGFSAGGATDVIARIMAARLTALVGAPFIIENRVGADGNIAAEIVARAPPDGHTLFITGASHVVNPALYKTMPFDADADFAPISMLGDAPNIVAVHPSVPAKSLRELVELAKGRPEQLNYASTASVTHLASELLNQKTGMKLTRVPYKGAAPGTAAILAGEVQVIVSHAAGLVPHLKSGALRGLAITSAGRSQIAPELPTVEEAGFPGYVATTWYGLMAPKGTRREIIAKLNGAMRAALSQDEVKAQLLGQGIEARSSTPEELGTLVRSDIRKWAEVVKLSGATID